jgi:ESCRT-I complex subunit VPS37
MSQETALALLQTSAAESEEQTEELVKQFLENEVTVDAFMDTFMAQRKEMHNRKVKADKLKDIIRHPPQRSAGAGPMYPQPGSGFYPPGPPVGMPSVPYPLGPTMPMPGVYRPF